MKKEIVVVNFRVAVKAFIIHRNKLLVLKRASGDIQKPGIWEIPGGRVELGEDPLIELMREVKEETGLYIDIIYPMSVRHFTRSDEQTVTMLIFLCKPKGGHLKVSEEHSEFKWINLKNYKKELNSFFHKEVEVYKRLDLGRLLK